MDNGHWQWHETIDPSEWHGFVYLITNLTTGEKYIGKKNFWSVTRKKVAGRKNRKVTRSPAKWKTYMGSSIHLTWAINQLGPDNFQFTILSLHESAASLSYAEVVQQVTRDVLRRKDYYNRQIAATRYIPPLPTPKEINSLPKT